MEGNVFVYQVSPVSRITGEREEAVRDVRGVEGRYWNEKLSAWSNGLHEKAETAISCRGPGPTRKVKEIYQ